MSNLTLRIVTGILLGIVLLGALWLGGVYFTTVFVLIGAAILYEWLSITGKNKSFWPCFLAFLSYSAIVLAFCLGFYPYWIFLICVVILCFYTMQSSEYWTMIGFFYALLPVLCAVSLRMTPEIGFILILFLFLVMWGSDVGAYCIGRLVGGAKLAPKISPNKTWSGAIGGWFFSLIIGVLFSYFLQGRIDIYFLILCVILSVASQFGDLFESWVKRIYHVKDSGWFLPGHGGFMDRFDSFAAGVIALYIIQSFSPFVYS